jgi:hypothetical protein
MNGCALSPSGLLGSACVLWVASLASASRSLANAVEALLLHAYSGGGSRAAASLADQ